MTVKFRELLEGTELSQEAQETLREAWDASLQEAREALTAELREEFAQRYEHDKGLIVEAVDNFVNERIEAEIAELVEDRNRLAEERVKYRKAVKGHAKLLDRFVAEQVAKEVRELRADRNRVQKHVSKLDQFVSEQLAEELSEFHKDKKDLVERKVKMVREGKRELAETKRKFIAKAAASVEKTVNKVISEEVRSFRKDITAARENDFGRRIFEAFATEYNTTYLNETKETRKIQKQLKEMSKQLQEAKKQIASREEKIKLAESKARVASDRYNRKQKLDALLRPLGAAKRELMSDLLESVKTEKLDEAFNKYLPSVLGGEKPRVRKEALNESVSKKEHTGDRKAPVKAEAVDNGSVVEINAIRKLAGLS